MVASALRPTPYEIKLREQEKLKRRRKRPSTTDFDTKSFLIEHQVNLQPLRSMFQEKKKKRKKRKETEKERTHSNYLKQGEGERRRQHLTKRKTPTLTKQRPYSAILLKNTQGTNDNRMRQQRRASSALMLTPRKLAEQHTKFLSKPPTKPIVNDTHILETHRSETIGFTPKQSVPQAKFQKLKPREVKVTTFDFNLNPQKEMDKPKLFAIDCGRQPTNVNIQLTNMAPNDHAFDCLYIANKRPRGRGAQKQYYHLREHYLYCIRDKRMVNDLFIRSFSGTLYLGIGPAYAKQLEGYKLTVTIGLTCKYKNNERCLNSIWHSLRYAHEYTLDHESELYERLCKVPITLREQQTKKTLMHVACEALCPINTVELLLNKGFDCKEVHELTKANVLHVLIEQLDESTLPNVLVAIETLCQKAPYLVNMQDAVGNTPLHTAVSHDLVSGEVVFSLLFFGASKKIQNEQGLTPIRLAERIENEKALFVFQKRLGYLRDYFASLE